VRFLELLRLLSDTTVTDLASEVHTLPIRITARAHRNSLDNFISLPQVKKLNFELLPLRSYEKYIYYNSGVSKYKAEARVMIDLRIFGGVRMRPRSFYVIRSNDFGVLLGDTSLRFIEDRAVVNDIGSVDAAPPPPPGCMFLSVSILQLLPSTLSKSFARLDWTNGRYESRCDKFSSGT
jgi:hypothetical protein